MVIPPDFINGFFRCWILDTLREEFEHLTGEQVKRVRMVRKVRREKGGVRIEDGFPVAEPKHQLLGNREVNKEAERI